MRRAWLLLMAGVWATGSGQAQSAFSCAASAVQSVIARAEGTTELVADVVLTCTGGSPTVASGTILPVNFTLTFNAPVTSRVLGTGGAAEALLLLDEPAPANQFPCDQPNGICPGFGNGTGQGYYGGGTQGPRTPNNRNVFQGFVPTAGVTGGTPNSLTWISVPVDPPGQSGTRVFRFTNIRLDATTQKSTLNVTSITASGQLSVPIAPASLQVARVLPSLAASVRDANDSPTSTAPVLPLSASGGTQTRAATLHYSGNYQAASRPRTVAPFVSSDVSPAPVNQNTPGTAYNSESGFYNGSFGTYGTRGNLGIAGLADVGTRFMATFTNIPAGFAIFVDLKSSVGGTARLVNTDALGSGPFSAAGSTNPVQLTVSNGTATAVWEVLANTGNTTALEQYDLGVYLSYGSGLTTAPSPISVLMRYAPFDSTAIPAFSGLGTTQTLVTFTAPPPGLTVSPNSLQFTGTAGGSSPAAQVVSVGATTSSPIGYSVTSTGSLALQIFPASGTTPSSFTVAVNTAGLGAGSYRDTITVSGVGATAASLPVFLTLTAAPQITSVNPQSVTAGGPAFSLTVNGANFVAGSTVRWNGSSLPTTFINNTQLAASVSAGLIASPGTAQVTVLTPDGTVSNSAPVTVTALTIISLTPSSVVAGSGAFALTITGTGFPQGASVSVGNTTLQPTSVTANSISVAVPATVIAQPGTLPVTVASPLGTRSNSLNLTVTSQAVLTSLNPNTVTATAPSFVLTINGTGFATGATATVGGVTLTPLTSSATQMTVPVPANAIAKPGGVLVSVTNPGGVVSNTLTLTVTAAPTITSLVPSSAAAGAAGFTLVVTGTGFANGTVVQWNGQSLSSVLGSPTTISAQVPASLVATAGMASVTVMSSDGAVSNALTFTINATITITALNPSSATAGQAAFTLTVTGSNFPANAVVQWNGQGLTTTTGTPTQVTAQVPANLVATAGTATITVAGNGLVSNALSFRVLAAPSVTAVSPTTVAPGVGTFTMTVTGTNFVSGSSVLWNGQPLTTTVVSSTQLTAQVPANLVAAAGTATITVVTTDGTSNGVQFTIRLPALPNVTVTAPATVTSGQDQTVSLTLGGTYPVDLRGTVTLTFAGDSGLPDDPAIQFSNGTRVVTFTVPAGTQPQAQQLVTKTGTVAGVITITPTFTASATDVTGGLTPQRITVARAAPSVATVTCTRNASGFNVVVDGFSNTREATQATFDFQAASGANLGTTQLVVTVNTIFGSWFGGASAAGAGGLFRYTQPFNVQGSPTNIASTTVRLANSAGTSVAATCQLQ